VQQDGLTLSESIPRRPEATTVRGALPGGTALAQATASGAFTLSHQRYWDTARARREDAAGTRALIDPQIVLVDARRIIGAQIAPVIPIQEVPSPPQRQERQ
jgi:hypothetical protein